MAVTNQTGGVTTNNMIQRRIYYSCGLVNAHAQAHKRNISLAFIEQISRHSEIYGVGIVCLV